MQPYPCLAFAFALSLLLAVPAAGTESDGTPQVSLASVLTSCSGAWIVAPTSLDGDGNAQLTVFRTLHGSSSAPPFIAADHIPRLPNGQAFTSYYRDRPLLLLAGSEGRPAWLGFPISPQGDVRGLVELDPLGAQPVPFPALVALPTLQEALRSGTLEYVLEGTLFADDPQPVTFRLDLADVDVASHEAKVSVQGLPGFTALAVRPTVTFSPSETAGLWTDSRGMIELDLGRFEDRPLVIGGRYVAPVETGSAYPAEFHVQTPLIPDRNALVEYVADEALGISTAAFWVTEADGSRWHLVLGGATGREATLTDAQGQRHEQYTSSSRSSVSIINGQVIRKLNPALAFEDDNGQRVVLEVTIDGARADREMVSIGIFSGRSRSGGTAGTLYRGALDGPLVCHIGPYRPRAAEEAFDFGSPPVTQGRSCTLELHQFAFEIREPAGGYSAPSP